MSVRHLFTLLSYLFALSFMLGLGLKTPHLDRLIKERDYRLMGRALLANLILIPLFGLILQRVFPMPFDVSLGFLLIAMTPGGLFGLHFAHLSRGNILYALKLALVLGLAATLMLPIMAIVLLPATVSSGLLDARIFVEMFLFVLCPLWIGHFVQGRWPTGAMRLARVIWIINPLLFAAQEILASRIKSLSLHSVGQGTVWACVLLVLASWGIGWILGGPGLNRRKVLAIDTSMRNVAICWLIAHRSFADSNIVYAILAFSGVSVPMNFLFALCTRFVNEKEAEGKT